MIVDLIYLMGRLPDSTAVWGDIYYSLFVKTHPQFCVIRSRGGLTTLRPLSFTLSTGPSLPTSPSKPSPPLSFPPLSLPFPPPFATLAFPLRPLRRRPP